MDDKFPTIAALMSELSKLEEASRLLGLVEPKYIDQVHWRDRYQEWSDGASAQVSLTSVSLERLFSRHLEGHEILSAVVYGTPLRDDLFAQSQADRKIHGDDWYKQTAWQTFRALENLFPSP